MTYIVSAVPFPGEDIHYTIPGLIELIRDSGLRELPFPSLGDPGTTLKLLPNGGSPIMSDEDNMVARATKLGENPYNSKDDSIYERAAICFANRNRSTPPHMHMSAHRRYGYVFHTESPFLPERDFILATTDLCIMTGNYDDVFVAYAHRGESTEKHRKAIEQLVERGIWEDHIVEITNLAPVYGYDPLQRRDRDLFSFGMNGKGRIGY